MAEFNETFDRIAVSDTFDLRDVIERYEELETVFEDNDITNDDERKEFAAIKTFLEEVKGYGGDEQWRGDWYPVTFICDSYFETYAQELAEEIDTVGTAGLKWPYNCIDWEQAARELRMDYSSVEIDGVTYWYR